MGRGSKTTGKMDRGISEESNLGKYRQNVLRKFSPNSCRGRTATVNEGPGRLLNLGKSRVRARGSTVQTEGEKRVNWSLAKKRRKRKDKATSSPYIKCTATT